MAKLSAKFLGMLALASSCAFLFSACGEGSGGNTPPPNPPVITAQATIPSSVTAAAPFTVSVLLTASDGSPVTASVQVVDVGTVTPLIDCGPAQTIAAGISRNFTCQAPQVNLGGDNTHQLQVTVDGDSNLPAAVPVDVVNGGEVDVALTDAAGTPITEATPGQEIKAAFTTTTTPLGVGSYTVTAPSGWTVGNSGVCDVNAQATSCDVDVTVASSAASGAYAITVDADEGSSPLSASSLPITVKPAPPSTISAHASIPSTVDAGKTFTVSVSLTSSGGSGGTASVQPVDVGTVTPQIDCGQAQTLTINGSGKDFSCNAPAVNLGGDNTHKLQVDVNGTPNLAVPVSVAVVNGGRVDVQLNNASGTVITAATAGQTINAAFSTTTTPAGIGKYTVTAPSGWAVGNGGVCEFTGQLSCKVPVGVAASAANGSYDLNIAAEEGSSPLSTAKLSISIQNQPPTQGMAFDLAQNISATLYANLPSQTTTFTYQPVFLFKNTSGASLSITAVNVNGLTNVKYGCNVTVRQQADYTLSTNPACTLTTTGLYAVSGDLANNFPTPPTAPVPVGTASISISVLGGGDTYVQHDASVAFVEYVPGHVAVRVASNNGATVYTAGVYGPNMVKFDAATHVGTASSDSSAGQFQANQLQLTQTGGLIYLPYGAAGVVYLTRGTGGFNTTSVPSPTGSPTPPAFLSIEMTYLQNVAGGQCSGSTCESLTVDQTYVNFISMLGSFNAMGNTSPLALATEDATHGTVANLTEPQIYQGIETYFENQGPPWKYDSANGQKNYIQKDGSGDTTAILAPIQVFGLTSFDPMASDYYDGYVNALWTYLEATPIHVLASGTGISNSSNTTTSNNCVLKGQVVPASSTSPNAGKLVFSVFSGSCPAQGFAVLGATPYNGSFCGYTGNQKANLACADTPNLVFAKPNACDFILAAGSGSCHKVVDPTSGNPDPQAINPVTFFDNENLWGPNGTFRAVVGRAIAAYQAAGLLPPCSNPGEVMQADNARADIANGGGFTNPSCLAGLTTPAWNVYAAALRPYADVYAYSYGDFLGLDGTITFSVNALPASLYQNLQVAQPITITLH